MAKPKSDARPLDSDANGGSDGDSAIVATSAGGLTKADRFKSVSTALFEIAIAQGLGSVTVSRVSARAKVSRAWIYKYYGKSNPALIRTAADFFRNELLELLESSVRIEGHEDWVRHLIEGTYSVLRFFQAHPAVFKIYLLFKDSSSELGRHVADYEAQEIALLSKSVRKFYKNTPERAEQTAKMIFGIRIGIVHRFLNEELSEELFRSLLKRVFEESVARM